jgi:23S rRNA maturation mini-RNase III
MMKLTVTPEQFEELIKRGYNLDVIFLLKLIDEQYDVSPLCEGSMRIAAVYQALIRKGLITETDDKLTTLGRDLLEFMNAKSTGKLIKRKPATTDFEEWWKNYPGTDSFEYKGKTFKGTRAIRKGKDECRLKFDKIILEGEYTAQQLIAALEYELLQKKESSIVNNDNRMTFMQNSVTYLNQRAFEAYIELINEGAKVDIAPQKPQGGTDI